MRASRRRQAPEVRKEILDAPAKPRTLLEQLQWEADQEMIEELPAEIRITDRPTTYKRETFVRLLREVASGRHLAGVCRDEGMPSYMTVLRWGDSSPVIAIALARAYESCAANMEADMIPIADYGGNDTYEGKNGTRVNTDVIQRSKLRIETREKLLKVIAGARWMQKVMISNDPKNPVGKPLNEYTTAELAARISALQADKAIDPEPSA